MSVTNTTIIGISCIPFVQKVKFLRFHNLILDETLTTAVVNFKFLYTQTILPIMISVLLSGTFLQ